MRVINKTKWQTAPLARIARRVLTLEAKGRPERQRKVKGLVLYIGYNRGGPSGSSWSSGHAPVNGWDLHVNVSSHRVDPVDFAFVVGHELGHVWGLEHSKMTRILHYERGGMANARYAWAKDIVIAMPPKKSKRRPLDSRLEHARTMQRRAATRVKRAQTLFKKWTRRVKALEKRAVEGLVMAAARPPAEPALTARSGALRSIIPCAASSRSPN